MKTFILLLFILCSSKCYCQTQSEMTYESGEASKAAEKKLDSLYKRIIKLYSDDTLFIKNFKLSQKTWQKYYLAQIKAMYPDYPYPVNNYSMFSMCVTSYAKELADLRIKEIEQWIVGREEGDCGGSIKRSDNLPKQTSN